MYNFVNVQNDEKICFFKSFETRALTVSLQTGEYELTTPFFLTFELRGRISVSSIFMRDALLFFKVFVFTPATISFGVNNHILEFKGNTPSMPCEFYEQIFFSKVKHKNYGANLFQCTEGCMFISISGKYLPILAAAKPNLENFWTFVNYINTAPVKISFSNELVSASSIFSDNKPLDYTITY